MDQARCDADGVTYTAVQFAELDHYVLENYRTHLRCLACDAQAYFRQQTRDGKAACFGSNSHQPSCTASRRHATTGTPSSDRRLSDQALLHITLSPASTPTAVAATAAKSEQPPQNEQRRAATAGLRTLLRHIVTEPALLYSDVLVQAAGFPELPAHTFFRRFEQLTTQTHREAHRGFWGTIISVRSAPVSPPVHRALSPTAPGAANHDLWLNSGPPAEPSVIIPADIAAAVLARAGRADPEDLVGCYVLVLGQCRVSAKGKVYITPASHAHIAFRDTEQA